MPWYYITEAGSQPDGPYVLTQLAAKFQAGELTADTYVWHGKRVKEWTKIQHVKGLSEKLARINNTAGNSSRGSIMDMTSVAGSVAAYPGSMNVQKTNTTAMIESVSEDVGVLRRRSSSSRTGERQRTQRAKSATYTANGHENLTRQQLVVKVLDMQKEIEGLRSTNAQARRSLSKDESSQRMVQIANLLCKTQDDLERKKQETEKVIQDNHEQEMRIQELETHLINEKQEKDYLRKQWKRAQREYEQEIKQYQAQLDIFFAAETELNNDVFSDEQSIQINLSYVE